MNDIPKNLQWIINKIQTQQYYMGDAFYFNNYTIKEYKKAKIALDKLSGMTLEFSKYGTIKIIEINDEDKENPFYRINPNIKGFEEVKVYKDKYELVENK